MSELIEGPRVGSIIGAFYAVYNHFGPGLSESIYAGALEHELQLRGHRVVRELAVPIDYRGRHIAYQRLDMVVDDAIIVEIKASELLARYVERQLLSYLRATVFEVGLLLHFGAKASFHRFVDTEKKPFVLVRAPSTVGTIGERE